MEKQPAIYIMANKRNGTLYTGVTSNLQKRVYEHKNKLVKGFSSKYGCTRLVYYKLFDTMESATEEEKRIKGGNRKQKLALIEKMNNDWEDLYDNLC